MSQQIHHIKVESFIRTKGSGSINFEKSVERLRSLCEVWHNDVNQNVLVDVRERTFHLTPAEIMHFAEIISTTGLGRTNKVAIVYRHRENFDSPVFLQSIAIHMGLKFKAFDDYEEAVDWLVSTKTLAAESDDD